MKIIWLSVLLVLLSCAISIKENADVRKYHFKGRVESVEEFTAFPEDFSLKDNIVLEDLSFATTLFQRFDKRGNLVDEMVFSEFGKLQQYDKYFFDVSGKKIAKERYDSQKEFLSLEKFEYDEQGRISKKTTYDNEDKIIETAVWNYQKGTVKEVFNSKEEIIKKEISEFDEENNLRRKVIFDYESANPEQTEILYNEVGKKSKETYFDKDEQLIGKITWDYKDNWLQKDEFNRNGFTLRKEKEFDDLGNLIAEKLFVPTFQPEIQEIDWEEDYAALEDFRFNPEQYNLYPAEEKTIFYEFDEAGNWVLRKMYVNKKLNEICERMISYF